ncbi:MAG: hypothetical protein Q8Q41_02585 [bacterium]|nr:hypothetical protein [bacterium]
MNTLTKLVVSGSTALALLGAAIIPAVAQTGSTGLPQAESATTTSPRDLRPQVRPEAREAREAQKAEFEQRREELKKQIQDRRDAVKENSPAIRATTSPRDLRQQVRPEVREVREVQKAEFEQRREELRKEVKDHRDAVKENFQAIRETTRVKVEEKREEFRTRAQAIKDERKKEIALRVDDQLNKLNERWTQHFMNVLDKLTDILGKVQLRMEKAEANGVDATRVKAAIAAASTAIETARQAVEDQAKKTYSVTFTSEEGLKQAMRNARQLLHRDLAALRDGVMKNARQAVQNAIQSLRDIPRVDAEPTATSTPPSATSTQ